MIASRLFWRRRKCNNKPGPSTKTVHYLYNSTRRPVHQITAATAGELCLATAGKLYPATAGELCPATAATAGDCRTVSLMCRTVAILHYGTVQFLGDDQLNLECRPVHAVETILQVVDCPRWRWQLDLADGKPQND